MIIFIIYERIIFIIYLCISKFGFTKDTQCYGCHLLALLLGSLGPSTVTLIAFIYVQTCGGLVATVIVRLKLFPVKHNHETTVCE